MKKITLLLVLATSFGFAQAKSSGVVTLQPNMTAEFTLNNNTSTVTLVLTGPSDRWFGIGIGVSSGFGMSAGDVLVYTNVLTDRRFAGTGNPPMDTSQSWTVTSDNVNGAIRTVTMTRALTNTDTAGSDFQMPYSTTNSFSIVGVRAPSATITIGSHGGGASAGYATATFTTLGSEDFSLKSANLYPNPTKGLFTIDTKTELSEINIYSHVGQFVKQFR
ncbi:MAG: hypothetical protein HC854_05790 [Flavobacterium sp.]|nr:hypothetical protein [Flavobacterium sp.]